MVLHMIDRLSSAMVNNNLYFAHLHESDLGPWLKKRIRERQEKNGQKTIELDWFHLSSVESKSRACGLSIDAKLDSTTKVKC